MLRGTMLFEFASVLKSKRRYVLELHDVGNDTLMEYISCAVASPLDDNFQKNTSISDMAGTASMIFLFPVDALSTFCINRATVDCSIDWAHS
jgi:hypothetical protein